MSYIPTAKWPTNIVEVDGSALVEVAAALGSPSNDVWVDICWIYLTDTTAAAARTFTLQSDGTQYGAGSIYQIGGPDTTVFIVPAHRSWHPQIVVSPASADLKITIAAYQIDAG